MKKRVSIKYILIFVPIVIALLYSLTYIPHKVISISTNEVAKITIFDGQNGNEVIIEDRANINHIINNLNVVKFKKGKLSIMYMGYSYKTTIYNNKGKVVEELIINSSDLIRYKGFFYTATNNKVDFDYLSNLVRK